MANPLLPELAGTLTLAAETAAELMLPNPVSIRADATVLEAIALLTDRGFGAAPVIDEAGRPQGVISRADILVHERERLLALVPQQAMAAPECPPAEDPTRVRDIMTPTVLSVTPQASAREVVAQMLGLKVHHLFVVDEAGGIIGIISPFDILRHLV